MINERIVIIPMNSSWNCWTSGISAGFFHDSSKGFKRRLHALWGASLLEDECAKNASVIGRPVWRFEEWEQGNASRHNGCRREPLFCPDENKIDSFTGEG